MQLRVLEHQYVFDHRLAKCDTCELAAQRGTMCLAQRPARWNGLMVVGEGPTVNEGRTKVPFLAKPGQILDALLAQSGLKREETFVTNATLCVPPRHDGNLDEDFPQAVPSCRPRLLEEIAYYEPRVVLALGRTALLALTGTAVQKTKREKIECSTCSGELTLSWYPCQGCKARVPFVDGRPLRACPSCNVPGGGLTLYSEVQGVLAKKRMKCPECEGKKTRAKLVDLFVTDHRIGAVAGAVFDGTDLGLPMVKYVIPSYHPSKIMTKAETKAQRVQAGQFLFSPALAHFQKAARLLEHDRAWPFAHRVIEQGPEQAFELKKWLDARVVTVPEGYYGPDYITIDIETDNAEPVAVTDIRCVGLGPMYVSNPYGEACQPIVVDTEGLDRDHPTVRVLRQMFEDGRVKKAGQNAILYDSQVFWLHWDFECRNFAEDTLYAHMSIAPDEAHDLQHIALTYTDSPAWKPPKNKNGHEQWESKGQLHAYNARDVYNTSLSLEALRREMAAERSEFVYRLDIAKAHVARGMDRVGMPVDPEPYDKLRQEAVKQKPIWLEKLREQTQDPAFNPNAPAQLAKVLFGPNSMCGFVATSFSKKTGAPSTKAEALFPFRKHPFVADLLEFRKWRGICSNYFGNPPDEAVFGDEDEREDWEQEKGIIVSDDWRIRCRWNPIGAKTGRWSSSPNLMNWPEEMRRIISTRGMWSRGLRRVIVGADMPQAELRVIAALSGDDKLIELCINSDEARKFDPAYDPHSYVASIAFPNYLELPEWAEKTLPDGTVKKFSPRKGLRDAVKAVIYGLNYGAGAAKVLETISTDPRYDGPVLSLDMVERIIAAINTAFPKVRRYRERIIAEASSTGHVWDALIGRRRVFPLLEVPPTEASNYAIQATVASMMDMTMVELAAALPRVDPSAFIISQVHDAIYIEAAEERAADVEHLLAEAMSQKIRLVPGAVEMPFHVTAKSHVDWAALG